MPPTPAMPALQTGSPSWSWTDFGNEQGVSSQDSDGSRFKFFVDDPFCAEEAQDYVRPILSDPVVPASPLINAPRQVFRLSDFV